MPTFDYSRPLATATRLIAKFGQTGTHRRKVGGGGPAFNPGSAAPEDTPATFAVFPYSTFQRDGTLIKVGDMRAYVSADGFTGIDDIKPSDQLIEANGKVWTVFKADPLQPGGVVLMWDCQLRR